MAEQAAHDGPHALLEDMFRRADKNDDGRLSYDEFVAFFDDESLGEEEMKELFGRIDTDGNGYIDTTELAQWFTANLGGTRTLFDHLEQLTLNLRHSLEYAHQVSEGDDKMTKATTAFLLRQAGSQLSHVTDELSAAHEDLHPHASHIDRIVRPITHEAQHVYHQMEEYSERVAHRVLAAVDSLKQDLRRSSQSIPSFPARQQAQQAQQNQGRQGTGNGGGNGKEQPSLFTVVVTAALVAGAVVGVTSSLLHRTNAV
ncbi:hypothetical protein PTSG_00841 [Salpingoeca rosetta]|uniref:EF-hand domain-containing protein n=1 Tax=Salpingoeca rosetta (strain ATCC 50818 / BSB-021) TaxID=946362 RepID=F2TXM5_SALR5|nr:uncharacterized protein PTSG_00841 [Salpingoeca rosetta]EGD76134.1 hypothetical protein PTSG_00841 [Salpingoeca rosetta]|eukprot:XP_004998309.1 hypothetical protein PTSG_00841 [Salpingoeca rosetta]